MKKLKICQINPGVLPIPRENWGAIEMVIWQYKKHLEERGHICDIKMFGEFENIVNDYDIIHVHTGVLELDNLYYPTAELAKKYNINYIFSIHDHHIFLDNNTKLLNEKTIQNSIISIAHGINVKKLYNLNNIKYLSHGVDTNFFTPNFNLDLQNHKLLCVASNGLYENPSIDRKGFIIALNSAKKLDLPLTIVGPKQNNEAFFNCYRELFNSYNKLNIIYDPNDEELREIYKNHTIFLHPSELEAGHPNLTILESISSGVPVIGTCQNNDIDKNCGVLKIDNLKSELSDEINFLIKNYSEYRNNAINSRNRFDWSKIVDKLELIYSSSLRSFIPGDTIRFNEVNIEETKRRILNLYENTQKKENDEIKFIASFNSGASVTILDNIRNDYDIKFIDNATNEIKYETNIKNNMWCSTNIKYYVDWKILINEKELNLNLENKDVLIKFESSALGDNLAWIPYCEVFQEKHKCNLYVSTFWNNLFEKSYKNLKFIDRNRDNRAYYATYNIGCWDNNLDLNKKHWQSGNLQEVACNILGLDYTEIKPKIHNKKIKIDKKYIAFTTSSTANAKLWNYENGWQILINKIKEEYDLDFLLVQNNKSDLTNIIHRTNQTIEETINDIDNAVCFIGLGSGLSWLAWALEKPVALISGFSDTYSEFYTPYRIINKTVCNSCYNDISLKFDRNDWNWCPRKNNFICTSSITPEMVIDTIRPLIDIYKRKDI